MPSASRLPEVPAHRTFDRATVRLLLHARRGLAVAVGLALLRLGASRVVQRTLAATVQQLRIDLSRLEEENRYLRDRLARIPSRERAHYTPVERFGILVLMRTHAWSVREAAARFLVTPTTVGRWLQEAASAPARRAVGTLLRAAPPVRRYADAVRDLVQQMDRWGFGGNRRVAQTLARAGVRIGRETVRRYRKAPTALPPQPPAHSPLRASGPNHVWLMDLTTVPRWLGLRSWQVLGILDAWSRLPVGVVVYRAEPHAPQIAAALRRAVDAHGAPRVLVSDRGRVFRSAAVRRATHRLRIQHRFGAVGQTGSIALLERFWRTLKDPIEADRPVLFVGVYGPNGNCSSGFSGSRAARLGLG